MALRTKHAILYIAQDYTALVFLAKPVPLRFTVRAKFESVLQRNGI